MTAPVMPSDDEKLSRHTPDSTQLSRPDERPSSYLFFLPTYEVPARGTVTLGAVQFLLWHVEWTPADFLQIGGATLILPPGASIFRVYSLGLKARLWGSSGVKPGLAVGTNYIGTNSIFWGDKSWHQFTGYVVLGWRRAGAELHVGVFPVVAEATGHGVYEIGSDGGRKQSETTYHLAAGGRLGLRRGLGAIAELWVLDARYNRRPLLISGLRLHNDRCAVEVGWILPFNDSQDSQGGFPLFSFRGYLR